jgi:hypothetical protein
MFAADSNGEITVVLNLAEDISLQEDYTIRELVNRVQRLRKEVDAGETLRLLPSCVCLWVFSCSFFQIHFCCLSLLLLFVTANPPTLMHWCLTSFHFCFVSCFLSSLRVGWRGANRSD